MDNPAQSIKNGRAAHYKRLMDRTQAERDAVERKITHLKQEQQALLDKKQRFESYNDEGDARLAIIIVDGELERVGFELERSVNQQHNLAEIVDTYRLLMQANS
jgi:hypothetical protein